jgi:hypothetical protein
MRIVTGLLAAVVFVVLMIAVGGAIAPMHSDDRNVPGATTGKGKSALTDN